MKKLKKKNGEMIVALAIVTSFCVFLLGRAMVKGELKTPQWHKEKTIDTVQNPAPLPWEMNN